MKKPPPSCMYASGQIVQPSDPIASGIVPVNSVRMNPSPLGNVAGSSNPNWRALVRAHQNACSAYSIDGWTEGQSMYCSSEYFDQRYLGTSLNLTVQSSGFIPLFGIVPLVLSSVGDSQTADLALSRFKSKLKSADKKVSVLVPIGELKDLRGTVEGAARVTTNLFKDLKLIQKGAFSALSTNKSNGKRYFKAAQLSKYKSSFSEAWLTYSFGINPMVIDTKNITDAIIAHVERSQEYFNIQAGARKTWNIEGTSTSSFLSYGGQIDTSATAQCQLDYLYKGGYFTVLSGPNELRYRFGLTPTELPLVAWELLPYSWVVDYFTNVGSFLEDQFSTPGGSLNWCCLDRRLTVEVVPSRTVIKPIASTKYASGYLEVTTPGILRGFSFSRTPIVDVSNLGTIGLHFKTVDQIGSNSVNKILNLASVYRQRTLSR